MFRHRFFNINVMAGISKRQGDDFSFSIIIYTDETKAAKINIDNLADLKVNVYTDGCVIARFSKVSASGYTSLVRISETEYKAIVDSSITRLFAPGSITVDLNIVQTSGDLTDGRLNMQASQQIGSISTITTKNES